MRGACGRARGHGGRDGVPARHRAGGNGGAGREWGRERGLAMALKSVCPPQSDDSDIWDDTALIKAYDKAVASFKVRGRRGRGWIRG